MDPEFELARREQEAWRQEFFDLLMQLEVALQQFIDGKIGVIAAREKIRPLTDQLDVIWKGNLIPF